MQDPRKAPTSDETVTAFPIGVRDGPFVKLVGYDVYGFDVGPMLFADLPEEIRIEKLKEATLRYGAKFIAFNNVGYTKTWNELTLPMFIKREDLTLWIRVEYPGWVFIPGSDSGGHDLVQSAISSPPGIIANINGTQNPAQVAGFNTSGWIKEEVILPLTLIPDFMPLYRGFYIRGDLLGRRTI